MDPSCLENNPLDLDLYHPSEQSTDQLLAIAKECEDIALSSDQRIVNSDGADVSSHSSVKVYGNTHGFLHSYASSRHSLSCMLIAQQNDEMQRDYSYTSARDMADLFTPKWVADDAVKRTVDRLGAKKNSHTTGAGYFCTGSGKWSIWSSSQRDQWYQLV